MFTSHKCCLSNAIIYFAETRPVERFYPRNRQPALGNEQRAEDDEQLSEDSGQVVEGGGRSAEADGARGADDAEPGVDGGACVADGGWWTTGGYDLPGRSIRRLPFRSTYEQIRAGYLYEMLTSDAEQSQMQYFCVRRWIQPTSKIHWCPYLFQSSELDFHTVDVSGL